MVQKWCSRIFFVSFLFSFVCAEAQQKINLESLIPPGPNASELGKYGTYPVGTLTGIPEIGFPLYEINSGQLKLPISLSYHASGIQVNERSTDVGLGWTVMAGGQITRTVYGAPDNSQYGYFNYTPPSYNTLLADHNFYDMQLYSNPGYDLEPDLFVYNIGGKSGKFFCDENKNFFTIPYEPIKIQKTGTTTVFFTLVDDDGVKYNFNQYSGTKSDFSFQRNTVSTWYLTSMVSADLTDTISFSYDASYLEDPMEQQSYPIGRTDVNGDFTTGPVVKTQSVNSYDELLLKQITFNNGFVQFNRNTARKDVNSNSTNASSLDEIDVYNNASQVIKKITFNHAYYTSTPFIDDWLHYRLKLTGFVESDATMVLKKEYKFDYDPTSIPTYGSYNMDYWGYANGASNALDLIPVTIVYASDINNVSFADGSSYNNALGTLTQSWTVGNANREPSATYMTTGILNKITYPTGGYSLFTYEPHQYLSDQYTTQVVNKGGTTVGISKLTKSETVYNFSFPSDPAFASTNPGLVTGNLNISFSASSPINNDPNPTQTVTLTDLITNLSQTWTHTGDLTVPLSVSVQYTLAPGHNYTLKNTVYGPNTVSINTGFTWTENTNQHPVKIGGGLRIKSIKNYNSDNTLAKEDTYVYGPGENGLGVKLFNEQNFYRNYEDVVSSYFKKSPNTCGLQATYWQRDFLGISKYNCINYTGSPVLYTSVTKYEGNATSNTGKTIFNYNVISDPITPPAEFINSGNYGAINSAWNNGELTDETSYKYTGTQYLPVSGTQYQYSYYNQVTKFGIMLKQYKQFVNLDGCPTDPTGPEPYITTKPGQGYFSIFPYQIKTGASRKTKETKIVYDEQNGAASISTVSSTQYQNLNNLYPTEQSLVTSDNVNNKKITRIKYPQDMTDAVSTAMVAKNILTPPLEEKTYRSISGTETLLSTTQTAYRQIGNLIVRDNIKASTLSVAPETRINYNQYDGTGNITEQQKTNDVKQSYIWGYNSAYPIAQVINASVKDVFHTSFEEGDGNSADGDSKTGKKSKTGGYSKSLSGLTNGQYMLSYWSKSGSTWSLQSSLVTVSSGTYNISLAGQIDEVRFYPSTAQMTTYTYAPLVGVTSQCDVNNRITYYEYDGLNRLKLIRDQDNNIIKRFDYQYQQSQ